jgi:hypothetical protein
LFASAEIRRRNSPSEDIPDAGTTSELKLSFDRENEPPEDGEDEIEEEFDFDGD